MLAIFLAPIYILLNIYVLLMGLSVDWKLPSSVSIQNFSNYTDSDLYFDCIDASHRISYTETCFSAQNPQNYQ